MPASNIITGNAASQPEVGGFSEIGSFKGLSTDDKHRNIPPNLVQATSLTIADKTTNYTALSTELGTLFTNAGAAGTVVISLPAAVVGMQYRGLVRAAQALRFDPNGSEVIGNPTAGSADGGAGKYITSSTVGAAIHLVCVATGRWDVLSVKGTWTQEP